ncbi:hypothetical protein UNSWCS_2037 [Campylobacter concisus UNSWCS]|uniref:Uncharacterized protein n=1 Tax=Campylobacter concisus UNSWCS TaxID=1242968 RepID=U2GGI5_9BACT|nr:hypothetical protein UNSWCS_2037 [Campylobacter concisus UNSWCS]
MTTARLGYGLIKNLKGFKPFKERFKLFLTLFKRFNFKENN